MEKQERQVKSKPKRKEEKKSRGHSANSHSIPQRAKTDKAIRVITNKCKTSQSRSRKDKDKDEDPSARSGRGLKKRKLSKDAEPTTDPKRKDSMSGSSESTKSQPKSSGKSVQSEEPVFEIADSDMPHDQEGNLGDNEDEPRNETASRHD
ncbi:hypothetical protein Tco_0414787 [Tanacetum coccineum]